MHIHTYLLFFVLLKVARRISPRVDDVVRSMYPPLDARLLEARTAALALAVTHLALVTRYGCSIGRSSRRMSWIDQALIDMEPHLLVRHSKPILVVKSSHAEGEKIERKKLGTYMNI